MIPLRSKQVCTLGIFEMAMKTKPLPRMGLIAPLLALIPLLAFAVIPRLTYLMYRLLIYRISFPKSALRSFFALQVFHFSHISSINVNHHFLHFVPKPMQVPCQADAKI
jgi:hypothetical protein